MKIQGAAAITGHRPKYDKKSCVFPLIFFRFRLILYIESLTKQLSENVKGRIMR